MSEQVLAYEHVLAWSGLALLLVLCLPFAGVQKLVLEICSGGLRLALLAVLGSAAYLWFRPEQLPAEVTNTLDNFPRLRTLLPEPGTQNFGIAAAALIVAVFLPVLAVLDVSRKLAGWRLRRLRLLAAQPRVEGSLAPAPQGEPVPVSRRIDRRTAAEAMAAAGSRRPAHAPDHRSS